MTSTLRAQDGQTGISVRGGRLVMAALVAAALGLWGEAAAGGAALPSASPAGASQEGTAPPPRDLGPAEPPPDVSLPYRETEQGTLRLHWYRPVGWSPEDRRPAVVFFFGGGWTGGRPEQFASHARRLADEGLVAATADYRVKSRHGTSPFECVDDGQAAIRFVREHASALGVDPGRVGAAGGSAGGHVALCTAVLPDPAGKSAAGPAAGTPPGGAAEAGRPGSANLPVAAQTPSRPDLVLAFNPVADTGPKGYGHGKLGERFAELSPVEHIRPGLPPMLIFHGTADTTVPFENLTRLRDRMLAAGNDCSLIPFEGMQHGFFNRGRHDDQPYRQTIEHCLRFLTEQGFLPVQEAAVRDEPPSGRREEGDGTLAPAPPGATPLPTTWRPPWPSRPLLSPSRCP